MPLPDNFNLLVNVNKIKFGNNFNQPLENLPHSLVDITLGDSFNMPLPDNFNLLKNIHTVNFGNNFNQPLNILPENIRTIILGDSFNQNVDFMNLNKLTYVEFGKNFFSSFKLPASTKYIKVNSRYEITDPNPNYNVLRYEDDFSEYKSQYNPYNPYNPYSAY